MSASKMLIATVVCALTTGAYSHSLAVCTKFSADMQSCDGYARNINTYFTRGDGVVITPPSRQLYNPCDETFKTKGANAYTTTFNMATASAGDTLTMTWPSNNHQGEVAAEGIPPSNNPRSPDDVYIYMTNTAQPTADLLRQPYLAKLPYSNCFAQSKYNNRPDPGARLVLPSNAFLCKGDYTIPAGTPAGTYTFVWAWKLGGLGNYTSCWDVQVGAGSGGNTGGNTGGTTGAPGSGNTGNGNGQSDNCVGGFGSPSACSTTCGQGTQTRTWTTMSGTCPFNTGDVQTTICGNTPCANTATGACKNTANGACFPVPFRDQTCFQSGGRNYCWDGRRTGADGNSGAYYVKRCDINSCPLPNIDNSPAALGGTAPPNEAEDSELLQIDTGDLGVGGGVSGASSVSPVFGVAAALAVAALAL